MTKAQFTNALEPLGFTAAPFDTNNAWGFGGGTGDSYSHPSGAEVRIGTAYFRHLSSEPFVSARLGRAPRRGVVLNAKGFTAALSAIREFVTQPTTPIA